MGWLHTYRLSGRASVTRRCDSRACNERDETIGGTGAELVEQSREELAISWELRGVADS